MPHILEDFCNFLDASPTAWHAIQETGNRLASIDAIPLDEGEKWKLEKNQRYFVTRGGSICAFSLPKQAPSKIIILAAHTDSPALKIKPNPSVVTGSFHQLSTEVYGAPVLHSWFNRDLAIAGRIVYETTEGKIEEQLIFMDETLLFIPQIALHLEREINDKLNIDKQDHLRPIFTLKNDESDALESLLRKQVAFKHMLSFDLFLVPVEKARSLGISDEFLASYRLDNLASSHACITAWANSTLNDTLQMCVLCDAEEIGSRTHDGAASTFVHDILKRICAFYNLSEEDFLCMKSRSLCISVDVAHAFNPNFARKYDPKHHLIPGQGIAIKYNADKKYVTDSTTAAPVVSACKSLNLPYQSYVTHSNVLSGSTIGPIFAHTLGIPTVDIGCAIFSMHSAREVMALKDHLDMCQLLTSLLQK